MSYENWKDKIGTFEVMDVRGKKLDFFPMLKAKAAALKNGEGLHIIQTFEPVPLYPVLALMGSNIYFSIPSFRLNFKGATCEQCRK